MTAGILHLNVDAGEGSGCLSQDMAFLPLVDQVNVALGGHAGDAARAQALARAADRQGVRVCLHPGLPDRAGFGRHWLPLSWKQLCSSLDQQRAVLPAVTWCKFHGALYNRAMTERELATQLIAWCQVSGITHVLAMPTSVFALCAAAAGLSVISEGFLDRTYEINEYEGKTLVLRQRCLADAVLVDHHTIIDRARRWCEHGQIMVDERPISLSVDTWCVHGDGTGALAILRALQGFRSGSST